MESLARKLGADCLARYDFATTGKSWVAWLKPAALTGAARLLDRAGYHLEDVLAVDAAEGYVVNYHFQEFNTKGRLELKVLVPHDKPEVPSLTDLFGAASWHERETHDFHGIVFTNHPNPLPLLLPEDADFHPLQKDKKASLKDLMDPGEVVFCDGRIAAIFADEAADEAADDASETAEGEG